MNAPRPGGRGPAARAAAPMLRLDPSPALDDHERPWHSGGSNKIDGSVPLAGAAVPPEDWPAWTDAPIARVLLTLIAEGGPDAS